MTLTLTVPQRVELARRLHIDPHDLDEERLLKEGRRYEELSAARDAERTYEDPTRIIRPAAVEQRRPTTAASDLDPDERALGDAFDDYMGIPVEDRR